MNIAILAFLAANAMRPGGDMRDGAMGPPPGGASAPAASVTIAAMPYTRTVTCGSYTLTGTATGGAAVTWAASPSGASGACTGTDSWSCVVDVDPDATGEGVETITVTSGTATDTETIGFYVDGEHSCFLAQSVNGAYNVGLSDLDAVATWENLGSSALDVTQGTGAAQPTFRTSIVGGQPVVRCDGGDRVAGATASDWIFLHDGTGSTIDAIASLSNTGNNTIAATYSSGTAAGFSLRTITTAATNLLLFSAVVQIINSTSANNVFTINTFNGFATTLASADTPDYTQYVNNSSVASASASGAFGTGDPQSSLNICNRSSATLGMTGDVFRWLAYPSSLTSTQRGINKAVDEWALGASLPVTP